MSIEGIPPNPPKNEEERKQRMEQFKARGEQQEMKVERFNAKIARLDKLSKEHDEPKEIRAMLTALKTGYTFEARTRFQQHPEKFQDVPEIYQFLKDELFNEDE